MNFKRLQQEYRQSLKSMDTEERLDLWFYRPLGFAWAKLFAWLHVTPNVVTIASIFLGVGGGLLLYHDDQPYRWLNYLGMFLIIWANTFDSADGQLARLTGKYSQIGRILDGLSGDLWFFAIYFTLVFREFQFGDLVAGNYFCYGQGHNWLLWTLAWGAGICHAKQASSADYYRQFHLYFLKGKEGSELESTEALTEQFKELSWGKNFMKKLTLAFYRNYTKSQEALTPAMQRLRKLLKEKYGEELPQALRDDFRAASLPLMKYTIMLSFNTRIIAMFISVAVRTPWLYFVFEFVVLNTMMVYMIVRHERICKSFISSIENGKY